MLVPFPPEYIIYYYLFLPCAVVGSAVGGRWLPSALPTEHTEGNLSTDKEGKL